MTSVRRSLLLSFAGTHTVLVVEFAGILVVARVLTPAEMGLFSVGAMVVAIATTVRDHGTNEFIVQERDLTPERMRAAFTVNLLFSWTLAALLWLLRDAIALFYREPALAGVIGILCLNFLLIPFGAVTMAWLRREMEFRALYWINGTATLVATCTAVALALSGFGSVGLAWSAVAGIATTVLMAQRYRPAALPWLPGTRELRRVLVFGNYATGIYILGQIGRASPDIVLGRVQGMDGAAQFARAGSVLQIVQRALLKPVLAVSMPHFAGQHRAGAEVRDGYLRGAAYLTGFAWPLLAALAVLAGPVVRVLFGDQWDAAVPVVRVLCVAAALEMPFQMLSEFLIAVDRVKLSTRLQALTQAAIIAAVIAAAPHGIVAVGAGMAVASALSAAFAIRALRIAADIGLADLATACARSALVAALCLLPALAAAGFAGGDPGRYPAALMLAAAGCTLTWLAAVFVLGHPVRDEVRAALGRLRRQR